MSAKTGLPPARTMALAEAKKLNGVVMTPSPGPTPAAARASHKRVGARGAPHGVASPAERGYFALQALDFRSQDEMLRGANALDGREDRLTKRDVLPL